MSQTIGKAEYNALVELSDYDRFQAEQRWANLMATRLALKYHVKFSYWPKQPTSILDLLA